MPASTTTASSRNHAGTVSLRGIDRPPDKGETHAECEQTCLHEKLLTTGSNRRPNPDLVPSGGSMTEMAVDLPTARGETMPLQAVDVEAAELGHPD